MKKHILIFEHDIIKYPPILSLVAFLFKENKSIILLGYCSDEKFIRDFKEKGGIYIEVIQNYVDDSSIIKLWKYFCFKHRVKANLKEVDPEQSRVWFFGEKCSWLLHEMVKKFSSNIYLFEIPSFTISLRYRFLSPSLNYKKTLKSAQHVICCEYNRSHITKSFFELDKLPITIPNKPNFKEEGHNVQMDKGLEELKLKLRNKKVILYQGIFNYPERKLDSFCEAIDHLPEDFVICLMGANNQYKEKLIEKYKSERVIFLEYIAPPHHLEITKLAYIGILVYKSEDGNICNTLNTLYCAPNKLYEYSRYGIPMISNDVPALSYMFNHFKSGVTVSDNSENIAHGILEISSNYSKYHDGSTQMYLSVDLDKLYTTVV